MILNKYFYTINMSFLKDDILGYRHQIKLKGFYAQ